MSRKRYTVEPIITKLREAEVELVKGSKTPHVCRKLEISEQTYYRWRKEYGGLRVNQARRMKELERNGLLGGAEGSRTLDLLNAIQALSQLSYGPTGARSIGATTRAPQCSSRELARSM